MLLLAYMKGNANLCRAIVRSGARLGVNNNQGVNIFNYQVATKQLLFRLLGKWPALCSHSASTVAVLGSPCIVLVIFQSHDALGSEPLVSWQ